MNEVKPKKALGQHFLTDMSVARRIAATLDDAGTLPVLEIGPGIGPLTRELAGRAGEGDDSALADTAIHFALLSYAAGVAGSRCVALLRERKEPPAKGKKEKERD